MFKVVSSVCFVKASLRVGDLNSVEEWSVSGSMKPCLGHFRQREE